MKKIFALLAVVLAVVSCQKEINGLPVDSNNEAAVSLSVALPDDATRAAGADSAKGGVTNVNMGKYDIRFILEVYNADGELVKDRMVESGNDPHATFNFRLIPGRNYKFVVWADFVNNGSVADLHYETKNGLRLVAIRDWTAIDESRDAYTAVVDVKEYSGSTHIPNIELTRPFAKLRVVTNDIKEMISVRPAIVKVNYFDTKFYTAFDAFAEEPINQSYDGHELVVNLEDDTYTKEDPDKKGEQTLFADYMFADDDRVKFTMDVVDNGGIKLPQVVFNTDIPVNRNYLTTVYGPILTDANNVTVTIKDAFENKDNPNDPPYYVELISGTKTETVVLKKSGTYIFEDLTVNADEAAVVVKAGAEVVVDVYGYAKLYGKKGIVVEDGATLTINGISKTRTEERAGNLVVVATEGSAIGGNFITINNLAGLTAKAGDVNCAYGIGAIDAEVTINNTKIDYVSGAFVQPLFKNDEKYGKSEPEGASAIGGKKVTLDGVVLVKAEGGSKAAAIGNRYWQDTEVVITNSTLGDVFGGNASAAIGGSRYNEESKHNVKILIENSTITNAVGGEAGAGIGSGYDTHCNQQNYTAVNEIVIKKSNITAKGGKYSPGIGAGYHSAYLTGSIDAESTINSTAGNETFYKDTYTLAQNLGYGVMDPAREFSGANTNVTFTVAGKVISTPTLGVAEGVGVNEEDEYLVTATEGLEYIAEQVNTGNKEYTEAKIVLDGDIDLAQLAAMTRSSAVANNWTPIGTEENPFKGSFDGNGKTIKNLALVESEAKEGKAFIGFFGYAKDATIKNVTFENVYINIPCLDIDHSQGHIGAVAGSLEGTSTIENVTVKGDIYVEATITANGASRVAVVAGGNSSGNVTMKNVHVIANEGSYLKANNNVGALAGQLQDKSVFENCSSNINVTGTKFFAGGIIGLAAGDQLFTNCHTTGDVTITAGREGRQHDHYRVGGIAGGWADGATKVCTLNGCSYTGELSGTNADGSVAEVFDYAGFVGRGYTLNNCAGSKVVIDGVSYVQVGNTAAEAGVYNVFDADGNTILADGVVLKKDGEYFVMSAQGLAWVEAQEDKYFAGKTIKLANDIDMTGVTIEKPIHFWNGRTTFDGQNYTISNLTMSTSSTEKKPFGLFGGTADIKNVKFDNANISGYSYVAVVAGNLYGNIENCHVSNSTVTCTYWMAGAMSGQYNAGNVTNCSVTNTTITGPAAVGALIGNINETAGERKVENCTVTGCTVAQNGSFGGDYDKMFGTAVGLVNIENSKVYINGCKVEDTTVKGATSANIFGLSSDNTTIYVDDYTYTPDGIIKDESGNLIVNSPESLEAALKTAGAAGAGDTTLILAKDAEIDMTDAEWEPIFVNGYNGADIVTVVGNGATLKGLTAPLFKGGFAGGSGIVIRDLTITESNIVSTSTQGSGAFIECVDSMETITLENCHFTNSSISGSRTGGLIGWTSGYSNENDGPVKTYVIIKNCSVIDVDINATGSAAAINGHAGASDWTYTTIENCTVMNCNINSTDDGDWRTGVVVGTANVGEVTISGITESGNTLEQTGKTAPTGDKRNYYGRFVPGTTGKLTIDGVAIN